MNTTQSWRLKRYGRFIPDWAETGRSPWKIFEAKDNSPEIFLTITDSGYLLIVQGQESLDAFPLLNGADLLKVHKKSDNLVISFTVKGEGRIVRMQFDGKRAEAIKECSSVVKKLEEHLPVTTHKDSQPLPYQPLAEVSVPVIQGQAVAVEPEVVQGSMTIKRLAQHFLGEAAVTLPQVYHHCSLAQGDLEPIVRMCLLDPTFPAFVEKIEGELKKLLQE